MIMSMTLLVLSRIVDKLHLDHLKNPCLETRRAMELKQIELNQRLENLQRKVRSNLYATY